MSTINDFLPKKEMKALVQAHVSEDVVKEVRTIMKKKDYTWNEVVTACLAQFVEMNKEGKKK